MEESEGPNHFPQRQWSIATVAKVKEVEMPPYYRENVRNTNNGARQREET